MTPNDVDIARTVVQKKNSGSIGHTIIYRTTLRSTQEYVMDLADTLQDGTVVVATTQTAGKGRMGHQWISPPGSLTFSILLRPALDLDAAHVIMAAAALSLNHTISHHAMRKSTIKWPNDILIDGRKVAGIITDISIQNSLQWVVIGAGVNVLCDAASLAHVVHPDAVYLSATSLVEFNPSVSMPSVLCTFLQLLDRYYHTACAGGASAIMREYIEACSWINGTAVTIRDEDNTVCGVVVGIDNAGSILLQTASGTKSIHIGDLTPSHL